MISSQWHLSLSLTGVRWVQPFSIKNIVVAWRRKIKKSLALSLQDFKLYFVRILHSWSHALDGGRNMWFLNFVENIMHESLRA